MKHNPNEKPKNHTIAHTFVMVLMIVLGAVFISGAVSAYKWYSAHANANYVKEYATLVRYEAIKERYHPGYTYTVYYEYQADDMIYSGICLQRGIVGLRSQHIRVGAGISAATAAAQDGLGQHRTGGHHI